MVFAPISSQALTGERIHNQCFVCGPKGKHYLPPLPLYPQKWDGFIHNSKTAGLSRKLNNLFSLTAIGVHGDFMNFAPGVSAVTLAGSRTYYHLLPAQEGQHAIRWFIHGNVFQGNTAEHTTFLDKQHACRAEKSKPVH
jgi:hypothetical protein